MAGVALLTDYILTVAVSVSAGVAALYSAFRDLHPYRVPIALGFIAIIAWGNLRGVQGVGPDLRRPDLRVPRQHVRDDRRRRLQGRDRGGLAPRADPDRPRADRRGRASVGIFLLLHAFASGGAAMTGVEAISNGVPGVQDARVEERPRRP